MMEVIKKITTLKAGSSGKTFDVETMACERGWHNTILLGDIAEIYFYSDNSNFSKSELKEALIKFKGAYPDKFDIFFR